MRLSARDYDRAVVAALMWFLLPRLFNPCKEQTMTFFPFDAWYLVRGKPAPYHRWLPRFYERPDDVYCCYLQQTFDQVSACVSGVITIG